MFNKSTSCNGLGTNPAGVWMFRRRFGRGTSCNDFQRFLMLATLYWKRCAVLAVGAVAFSAFRRQRFGIFSGCCFAWFGHESCCCSAVSQAVRQRLWTLETCRVERSGRVVLFLLLETFAFSAFRRQRFGIFSGCCFAWFGHESCCCSAVSQAVRQRLWTLETLPRRAFWKRCAVFAVGDFCL